MVAERSQPSPNAVILRMLPTFVIQPAFFKYGLFTNRTGGLSPAASSFKKNRAPRSQEKIHTMTCSIDGTDEQGQRTRTEFAHMALRSLLLTGSPRRHECLESGHG